MQIVEQSVPTAPAFSTTSTGTHSATYGAIHANRFHPCTTTLCCLPRVVTVGPRADIGSGLARLVVRRSVGPSTPHRFDGCRASRGAQCDDKRHRHKRDSERQPKNHQDVPHRLLLLVPLCTGALPRCSRRRPLYRSPAGLQPPSRHRDGWIRFMSCGGMAGKERRYSCSFSRRLMRSASMESAFLGSIHEEVHQVAHTRCTDGREGTMSRSGSRSAPAAVDHQGRRNGFARVIERERPN
jgi:hypothetical protein